MIPTALEAGTINDSNIIGVNAQLNAFYEAGNIPNITVQATSMFSESGTLTMSGYLVNLL